MKRMQTRIMKKVCTSVALSHDKTNMQQKLQMNLIADSTSATASVILRL